MNKKNFYGLDASDIEMLIRARDYLDSITDTLKTKVTEMEKLPEKDFSLHRNEYTSTYEIQHTIESALKYVERAFNNL